MVRGSVGIVLILGLFVCLFAPVCRADEATPSVSLESRTWSAETDTARGTPRETVYVRTDSPAPSIESDRVADWTWVGPGAPIGAEPAARGRTVAHAKDAETDRFHVTALRLWLYRDFLPKSDDSDIFGVEINSAWGLGCLDFANISYFELVDYPRAVQGRPGGNPVPELGAATGITDLLTAFLASPKRAHHGPHHWSAGIAVQIPTASDSTIGSGKWAAGPAIEYEYHNGRFFAAFVALQIWSFAGDADRKDVNMLMIKPMITYDLGRRFKAIYMPYGISVYWNKSDGNRAYVPLGGGLQYEFCIGRQKMAASVQLFSYVVRPGKGSEADLRFMLEFDF